MSTKERYSQDELRKDNPMFSRTRATIESAFYGNNVHEVTSVAEAYNLAKKQSGVIVTDLPILHTKELGLPHGATQLVYNHGKILGRTASARHFVDNPNEDAEALDGNLREDIYKGHEQKYLKATVLVGLDPSFTVKAHIMMPDDQAFHTSLTSTSLTMKLKNYTKNQNSMMNQIFTSTSIQMFKTKITLRA